MWLCRAVAQLLAGHRQDAGSVSTIPCPSSSCAELWLGIAPATVLIPGWFVLPGRCKADLMNQRICSIILLKNIYCKCKHCQLLCEHGACIAIGSIISYEDILHSRICSFWAHEYSGSSLPFLSVHCTDPFLSSLLYFFSSGFN